ncbi:hypothetical protein LMH87_006306 [Akanthomyces muscarius]|uniref:Uncharacterized protein n=1 Tax=Akanthomyces muscarius TaxID=2231603 RepID=A0A9W8QMG4_AKAMU|nr:hypothetical protein LMH87_006306 [Akanthomyces muscarius]KAJ4164643.1 hypothetical protein LMH87_006306 [Akanthomyces muscarius]
MRMSSLSSSHQVAAQSGEPAHIYTLRRHDVFNSFTLFTFSATRRPFVVLKHLFAIISQPPASRKGLWTSRASRFRASASFCQSVVENCVLGAGHGLATTS